MLEIKYLKDNDYFKNGRKVREMVIDKPQLKDSILRKLRRQYGKTIEEAHEYEIYYAVSRATLDYVVENWYNTKKTYAKKCVKQIYYFSAVFVL